jgi:CMP-N-acetylneuraminic acid synthetase
VIQGRTVLAVVPARGGSKGIPLKNLRLLGGVPLVARVGPVISAVTCIDRAVVSTDHDEIARVAESVGISAPFRRPPALSGDRIGDVDVLSHALLATEALDGARYDIVVMLQPTSPLRRPEHVHLCIEKLVSEGWDSVWTVSDTDSKHHPLKQLSVDSDGRLEYYDVRGAGIIARQQLEPLAHRNGVAYAITRECLLEQRTIKGKRAGALRIEGPHVSIDTEWDLAVAELALRSA